MEAIELQLDEAGRDAFVRLAKTLPEIAVEFGELSSWLGSLGSDLVIFEEVSKASEDASVSEVISDLETLASQVQDEASKGRLSGAAKALRRHRAWRHDEFAAPQTSSAKESVGVYLRLPPSIAGQFPEKAEDPSPPHVTLCFVGDCDGEDFSRVVRAVQSVAAQVQPFKVDVHDYGEFSNPEGKTIAHAIPRAHGEVPLDRLHGLIKDAVERELGRSTVHHPGPFKAHSTLAYLDKGKAYDGPKPKGSFKARRIEVWGNRGGDFGRVPIELGSGELGAKRSSGVPVSDGMNAPSGATPDLVRTGSSPASAASGLVAKDADLSTGDLASRGGALVPAQSSSERKRPKVPETVDPWKFAAPQTSRKDVVPTTDVADPYPVPGQDPRADLVGKDAVAKSPDTHIGPQPYRGPDARPPRQHQSDDRHCSCNGKPCSCDGPSDGTTGSAATTVAPRDSVNPVFADVSMRAGSSAIQPGPSASPRGVPIPPPNASDPRFELHAEPVGLEAPSKTKKADADEDVDLGESIHFSLLSKAEDERTVFGVVLEPETIDAQRDIYSADEIRKTAWKFMERYQRFGLMHQGDVSDIFPLESYLAPVAFEMNGQAVKKGTWLLRVRVLDDGIWSDVKSGRLTGFSIGGSAIRQPVKS